LTGSAYQAFHGRAEEEHGGGEEEEMEHDAASSHGSAASCKIMGERFTNSKIDDQIGYEILLQK
jgi:hypothetical protein